MNKRPLSVTIIACLFIGAGLVGLAYHITEFKPERSFQYEVAWVCLLRLLAVVSGVFLLKGSNWAPWLLLFWMAYHIILAALHTLRELVIHTLLFAGITWFLFRRPARAYFRGKRTQRLRPESVPD